MTLGPEEFDTGLRPEDLKSKRARFVVTPWGEFAFYGEPDGELFCAQAFCPHLLGPLYEGPCSERVVTCPWHQWRYRVDTGERVDDPSQEPIATCEVRIGTQGTLVLGRPARPLLEGDTESAGELD